jgi:hypothetical protein
VSSGPNFPAELKETLLKIINMLLSMVEFGLGGF